MCQSEWERKSPQGPWGGPRPALDSLPGDEQVDGTAAWRSTPSPGLAAPPHRLRVPYVGPSCPPHPEAGQIPSRPSVQKQDRLGMKSQLEGAGLGLPLQGGAWGHDPGSRQPRREDAFREEAGENTHTHIAA